MDRRSIRAGAVVALAGAALSAVATAERASAGPVTATWVNALGGAWADGANWSTSPDFPNNNGVSYNAVIDAIAGPYTVTVDQMIRVTGLTLSSGDPTLDLGNFNLEIDDAYLQEGALLTGGTGIITVSGSTEFRDVSIMGVAEFRSNGMLTFNSLVCDDICDTPVFHNGAIAEWIGTGDIALGEGASITLGSNSTFNIRNDRTLMFNGMGAATSFTNNGTIVKDTGTGVTFFDGVAFDNAGTLQVDTGTFMTNGVDVNGAGGTLTGGSWIVADNAAIDLVGQMVTTLAADVALRGAGSQFDAVEMNLATIDASGRLSVEQGRNFTTAGDFTNQGGLAVDAMTMFEVPAGSMFTNVADGAITGGRFEIAGALRYDGAAIDTIAADVALSGAGTIETSPGVSAIDQLAMIDTAGALRLRDGASFTTQNDFEVVGAGLLSIDAGSEFVVDEGFELDNFVGGVFVGGVFDVRGVLQAPNAMVDTIENDITLDGPGAMIRPNPTEGAFDGLTLINPTGALTLRNGAMLDLAADLTVHGRLVIEGPVGGLRSGEGPVPQGGPALMRIDGDLVQPGGTLEMRDGSLEVTGTYTIGAGARLGAQGEIITTLVNDGEIAPGPGPAAGFAGALLVTGSCTFGEDALLSIDIGGLVPGTGYDQLLIEGAASFDAMGDGVAATLRITFSPGFTPDVGESFEVMTFASIAGGFRLVEVFGLDGSRQAVCETSETAIIVHVVPAPGARSILAAGLAVRCGRRRNRAAPAALVG